MTLEQIVEEKLKALRTQDAELRDTLGRVQSNISLLMSLNNSDVSRNGTQYEGKAIKSESLGPNDAVLEFVRLHPGLPRSEIVNQIAAGGVILKTRSRNFKALLSTTVQKAIKDKKIVKKGDGFVLGK